MSASFVAGSVWSLAGGRAPTPSEPESVELGVTQYPMPSLLICARITEDVCHVFMQCLNASRMGGWQL